MRLQSDKQDGEKEENEGKQQDINENEKTH